MRSIDLRILTGCLLALVGSAAGAGTVSENFATDPVARGWQVFGDTNLFQWDAANENLRVTWDSSKPNSFFHIPLGTILARDDDFALELDLRLDDVATGINPAKPSTFQLAFGFQNVDQTTQPDFLRGNGHRSPNLAEFNFFPGGDFAPTIWPSLWSTNSQLNYNDARDYTLLELPLGVVMRITMSFSASNQALTTTIRTNGQSIGEINPVTVSPAFTDFRAGTFALASYSDDGQEPPFGGSLLAHGVVDNLLLTVPPPPIGEVSCAPGNEGWDVQFLSRSNWLYSLVRSTNPQSWTTVTNGVPGTGSLLVLRDPNAPANNACYRVIAQRP